MSDKRIRRPDDGPRSDGNTEETVRYPATLRPPGVREGDLVPPHLTTAPTPIPEPPVRLNKTKLGLGAAAPGGTFFARDAPQSSPPSSDAVTRVQPAPTAARSAFAKAPSMAPPHAGNSELDDDERMMNSHGLMEPWLAPTQTEEPFQKSPSTRPPAQYAPHARPVATHDIPVAANERGRMPTQVGMGPSKPPPPPGRASAAPRPANPPRAERVFPPPEAKPKPAAHTAPAPRAQPTPERPISRPLPPLAMTPEPTPQRAAPRASSQPERAISRPLPPLASAPVAAPRPPAPPRAQSDVRLALDAHDVIDGATRSQRPAALPGQRRNGLTWMLLTGVVVSAAVLAWLATSGDAPEPSPQPTPPEAAASAAPAEPAPSPAPPTAEAPEATPAAAPQPEPAAAPQAQAPEKAAAPEPAVEPPAKAEPARRPRREREPAKPAEKREDILQARDALRALSEGKPANDPVLTIEPAGAGDKAAPPAQREATHDTEDDAPQPVLRLAPAPEPEAPAADDPYAE